MIQNIHILLCNRCIHSIDCHTILFWFFCRYYILFYNTSILLLQQELHINTYLASTNYHSSFNFTYHSCHVEASKVLQALRTFCIYLKRRTTYDMVPLKHETLSNINNLITIVIIDSIKRRELHYVDYYRYFVYYFGIFKLYFKFEMLWMCWQIWIFPWLFSCLV